MTLPNFLIVGAPKCGTTSLYHYLKGHPEIYMSPAKEPKFITSRFLNFPFNGPGDDLFEKRVKKKFNDYSYLFKNVTSEKAIGEASADTLYYYKQSIPIIKEYLGDVKIIIILRNPIDRTFSHYNFFIRIKKEYLSFEDALKNENLKIKNNWAFGWHYTSVGLYFNQVKAFTNSFSNVKVLWFDDLKTHTNSVIKDINKYLNVNTNYIPVNSNIKYNVSGTPKYKYWHKFLTTPNKLKVILTAPIKWILPPEKIHMYRVDLVGKNLYKTEMNSNTRVELVELFREDIIKLEDLLSKDLSHWLK